MMRFGCVVLAGCVGGWGCWDYFGNNGDLVPIDAEGHIGTFDEELPAFRTNYCGHAAACEDADLTACETHVTDAMAQAKAKLDEMGEMDCARCMWFRGHEARKMVAEHCRALTEYEQDVIFGACSTLARSESNTAACGGFP
jgi:hypothetical protein